jgi:hypothetical protein
VKRNACTRAEMLDETEELAQAVGEILAGAQGAGVDLRAVTSLTATLQTLDPGAGAGYVAGSRKDRQDGSGYGSDGEFLEAPTSSTPSPNACPGRWPCCGQSPRTSARPTNWSMSSSVPGETAAVRTLDRRSERMMRVSDPGKLPGFPASSHGLRGGHDLASGRAPACTIAGFPAPPSAGEAARAVIPGARIAYVDNDPSVTLHVRATRAHVRRGDGFEPVEGVAVAEADLREPGKVMTSPDLLEVIDPAEPRPSRAARQAGHRSMHLSP